MSNTNIQKQPHAVTCDLPIISIGTEKQIKCCVTLLTRIWIQNETSQSMVPLHSDEWQVLMTPALTKDHRSKVVDPGLLSRAQQQTRMWRNHCDKDTLPYFPFLPQSSNDVTTCRYDNSNRHWLLWTGTSIVFHDLQQRNGPLSVMVVDRHEQRKNQQQQQQQCDSTDETKEQTPPSQNDCGKESWPNKLAPFLHYQNKSRLEEEMSSHIDENEIDIDNDTSDVNLSVEEHSHHAKFYNSPYILVLGTGCASPSPYRGASGYALVLPVSYNSHGIDATVVAIDTGEGFCTQWNRYAGNVPLSAIKVIWISHAHWDHYGGMINVLKLINETCMNKAQSVDSNRTLKRPRASTSPVVVAPKKVLAFLRIMLGDRPDKYYRAVASDDARSVDAVFSSINLNHETTFGYHDPKTGLSPFLFWENIRVDHSCYQSYGFVFGLKGPMVDDSSGRFSYNGTPIIVSYSGDTRPSANLVQSCRRRMAHHDSWRLDLLIHEATFDESRKEMALIKKHSTVQEAIRVGQSLDSRRLLLTHFSQRYCHFDHISEPMKYIGKTSVGFALDGIIIQLSPSEHKVIRHRLA
jgi:ribonuclease BN (tRNA processing enzyme)